MKKSTRLIIIIAITAAVLAAAVTAFILVKNNKTPDPTPVKEEIKVKEQVTAEIMSDLFFGKGLLRKVSRRKRTADKIFL